MTKAGDYSPAILSGVFSMLKIYEYNGLTYQFEEGKQPNGAKEVKPETKERKPANKSRATRTKKVQQ